MFSFEDIESNTFTSATMVLICLTDMRNNNGLVEIFTNTIFKYTSERINGTVKFLRNCFKSAQIHNRTFNPDTDILGHWV